MNTEAHEPRILLGASVLGCLSDEDHRAFSDHLRSCRQCQHELDQLAGIPRLLDLVDPADMDRLAGS